MLVDGHNDLYQTLNENYPFLSNETLHRLIRSYGLMTTNIFGDADTIESLGIDSGSGLYEKEVKYLIEKEWARFSDDILYRRSKLGLTLPDEGLIKLNSYLDNYFHKNEKSARETAA